MLSLRALIRSLTVAEPVSMHFPLFILSLLKEHLKQLKQRKTGALSSDQTTKVWFVSGGKSFITL